MARRPGWHYVSMGEGTPLVLLHGLGGSHLNYQPVMSLLVRSRRVVAFDLPGFGKTPALEGPFSAPAVAERLPDALSEAGIDQPVDLVGNSLGAWVAFEAARRGVARSVVALAPGGLWRNGFPLRSRAIFRWYRVTSKRMPGLTAPLMRRRWTRRLLIAPLAERGADLDVDLAIESARGFGQGEGFEPALRYISSERFRKGSEIEAPVTIAFGDKDRILPARNSRFRDEVPSHARWVVLRGCGHVPMFDDPEEVARLILTAIA